MARPGFESDGTLASERLRLEFWDDSASLDDLFGEQVGASKQDTDTHPALVKRRGHYAHNRG